MLKNKRLSIIFSLSILTILLISSIFFAAIVLDNSGITSFLPKEWISIFTRNLSEQEAFEQVYKEKVWGEGSGIGSLPMNVIPYLEIQQQLFYDENIQTIVDLGCGDWQLMKHLTIPNHKIYTGYDLVESIIQENQSKYERKNIHFVQISSLYDMKNIKADLLILKDVMHHWPNQHIQYSIDFIIPNYKYAIIVNDYQNFGSNADINFGEFRPIDLGRSPFRLNDAFKIILDFPSHGIVKRIYFYKNPKYYTRVD